MKNKEDDLLQESLDRRLCSAQIMRNLLFCPLIWIQLEFLLKAIFNKKKILVFLYFARFVGGTKREEMNHFGLDQPEKSSMKNF